MFKLLTEIGEFLAVDTSDVHAVEYFEKDETALKIITKNGNEILLNLAYIK